MWLFVPHSMVKIQPFSPVFPLAESLVKAFSGYSFGTSKKKHQRLPMAQPFKKAGINHFLGCAVN
ncbi:hypothetical protein [uncultured Bilophila sp.]|uniref:hypothetical protein n=1 Tax=uncultured Bilophila sp. TaxID=529385 RepID=UPI00266FC473|nr:hypothetical protein [uncultured Bilophila sp.]